MPSVQPRFPIGPLYAGEQPLEVWGGAEYTCNRVQDCYFDQKELSGHAHRLDDYDRFLELGIKTLRVGLLWERHELDPSWRWADERISRLRDLQIRPIVSLVHHGSGPPHTGLLDPAFPEKLAAYAAMVAERYPWVDAYTPVNEPHTTARFSALYGIWYPHHISRRSYLRALLNQLRGTVLAMREIRRVRPDASFIQTEDVGTIVGTEEIRSTWELLHLRRWLPYDLLCGKVDRHHPLFTYLKAAEITEAELYWFVENTCRPSVVGVNYYVTSDRYLDHRVDLYPRDRRSAEGPFVDVEAVRVRPGGLTGVSALLEEAWRRYQIPVAITEIHLGSSVDDQIRWLAESWLGAMHARARGVSCVAVAPWALLGSFFWNQLVTTDNGHYEPGVFDLRSGCVATTELATVVAQIARGSAPCHPALQQRGWWHDAKRLCFPMSTTRAA